VAPVRIDHVIYSTADLDAAEAVIRDFGLDVAPGGVHDGLGTHNRLVPLGGAYLELLAIHDPAEAEGRGFGPALLRRGEGLLGWAAAVDDLAVVIERLGLSTLTVSRQGMTAQVAGVEEAMREPYLPFFIERKGDRGPSRIEWLEVGGDAERLHTWLGGAELPVRAVDGPPRVVAVGIDGRELRS
jgi:Glyoxalase-like domain